MTPKEVAGMLGVHPNEVVLVVNDPAGGSQKYRSDIATAGWASYISTQSEVSLYFDENRCLSGGTVNYVFQTDESTVQVTFAGVSRLEM